MAERRISAKQIQRNDTRLNWSTKNPVLDKAEIGVESDTGRFKIGNGTSNWNVLSYATGTVGDINTGTSFQLWIGTQDEYYDIADDDKNANTIYIVK